MFLTGASSFVSVFCALSLVSFVVNLVVSSSAVNCLERLKMAFMHFSFDHIMVVVDRGAS